MNPDIFSNDEEKSLKECVEALKLLPVYSSLDFEDITGIDHEDVDSVLNNYPDWDLYDEGGSGYDASSDVIRVALSYLSNGSTKEKSSMRNHISNSVSFMNELHNKFNSFSTLDPNSINLKDADD